MVNDKGRQWKFAEPEQEKNIYIEKKSFSKFIIEGERNGKSTTLEKHYVKVSR